MIGYLRKILVFLFISNTSCFLTPRRNAFRHTQLFSNPLDDTYIQKEYYNYLVDNEIIGNDTLNGDGVTLQEFINERIDAFERFKINFLKIQEFNSNNNNNFKLKVNQFIDTYDDELGLNIYETSCCNVTDKKNNSDLMKKTITIKDVIKNDFISVKQMVQDPAYYIDKYRNMSDELVWDSPIVSPVKNQMRCGSCWAFSSTGAIESNMRLNNYSVERLSEQELVDCSLENHGCNGGLMHLAFDYCIENDGLTSNEDYNYTAKTSICRVGCNSTDIDKPKKMEGSNIQDYKFMIPRSVIDIKASLKQGPISIALDASRFEFRFYSEGVIDIQPTNTSRLNHAVLLTGYENYENGSYWIIQNSWGKSWGDDGYAKIKIQNGDGILLCQLYGVYPYN